MEMVLRSFLEHPAQPFSEPMQAISSVLRKLEFEKVLERVSAHAVSEPGKTQALNIRPMFSIELIEQELQRLNEAKELLLAEGTVPLEPLTDVSVTLKKATVENQLLTPRELLNIARLIHASVAMASFLRRRKAMAPALHVFVDRLAVDRVLEYNITQAIDENGNVKDSASKELRAIRAGLAGASEELRNKLAEIMKRVSQQDFLQDEIITTRDGRMVIPVKVEHKRQVPGFIHSSSASGQTVFIEPAETLDLNNAVRELQIREQREIERILRALTRLVEEQRQALEEAFRAIVDLDVLFAKAKYSIEVQGNPVRLAPSVPFKLIEARHPVLLQRHRRDEVVPLTFVLDKESRTVVITGPNAGGKSVALKTIGLLCLMAQAALHIPASPESELPLFQEFFLDIGDEQSIENDLSTFSSHLVNLKQIVAGAGSRSLVLIDEIGTGTDPAEGSALAAAVLEELTARKAITIATTHHGSLKAFAHSTPGMVNASLEFDAATLSPTYRFRMGVPGSSYAFELAQRFALDANVLARARSLLDSDRLKVERLLVDLERTSQEYAQQLRLAEAERDRYLALLREYESRLEELNHEARRLKREAAEQAKELIENARGLIEQTIREIRETNAQREVIKKAKQSFTAAEGRLVELAQGELQPGEEESLEVGDFVRLRSGTEIGEIVERRGNEVTVLWGNARLRVRIQDLVRVSSKPLGYGADKQHAFTVEAHHEIDLRGMTGDEAISQIEVFLDNAIVAGLHRVDIIHGKGTGALRKRVTEYLKSHPHVRSFRLGEWNEGGAGVTVVELG